MSGPRDNGGPAFPVLPPVGPDGTSSVGYPYPCGGMTLRDYFAASALTGLLAQAPAGSQLRIADFASAAYSLADAMLAERAK